MIRAWMINKTNISDDELDEHLMQMDWDFFIKNKIKIWSLNEKAIFYYEKDEEETKQLVRQLLEKAERER